MNELGNPKRLVFPADLLRAWPAWVTDLVVRFPFSRFKVCLFKPSVEGPPVFIPLILVPWSLQIQINLLAKHQFFMASFFLWHLWLQSQHWERAFKIGFSFWTQQWLLVLGGSGSFTITRGNATIGCPMVRYWLHFAIGSVVVRPWQASSAPLGCWW